MSENKGIENLIPIQTAEEAREKGRNGGKKSGEARRNKKSLREALKVILETETTVESEDGEKLNGYMVLAAEVMRKALKGDVKAFEVIRDTVGEMPKLNVGVDGNMKFNDGGLKQTLEALKRQD